jgi:TonB family protein
MSTILLLLAAALAAGDRQPARVSQASLQGFSFAVQSAGVVVVDTGVDAQGAVQDVRLLRDVAPFGALLHDSVATWSFTPAQKDGVAVPSRVMVAAFFRPPMLMFPAPAAPPVLERPEGERIPYPTGIAVPPYPANAMGSAAVFVEVRLDETGAVTGAQVVGPSSGFDDAAVQAAKGWSFAPAVGRDGQPRATIGYVVFVFRQPG